MYIFCHLFQAVVNPPIYGQKSCAFLSIAQRYISCRKLYDISVNLPFNICWHDIFAYLKGEFNADLKMLLYSPSPGFN